MRHTSGINTREEGVLWIENRLSWRKVKKPNKCMRKMGQGPKMYGCNTDITGGHSERQTFSRSRFDQRDHKAEGAQGRAEQLENNADLRLRSGDWFC